MRPDALFVDCYGTLVEGDRRAIDAVTRAAAARAGVDAVGLDRAWYERFRTLCAERCGAAFGSQRDLEVEAMSEVLAAFGVRVGVGDVAGLIEPLFSYWRTARPFADALELLRGWTACPVLVVSNIDRADIAEVLRGLPPVAGVVTSEDARAYKPDRALFRHALTVAGATPDSVVHVGDSWESDVVGAAGAASGRSGSTARVPGGRGTGGRPRRG